MPRSLLCVCVCVLKECGACACHVCLCGLPEQKKKPLIECCNFYTILHKTNDGQSASVTALEREGV